MSSRKIPIMKSSPASHLVFQVAICTSRCDTSTGSSSIQPIQGLRCSILDVTASTKSGASAITYLRMEQLPASIRSGGRSLITCAMSHLRFYASTKTNISSHSHATSSLSKARPTPLPARELMRVSSTIKTSSSPGLT